MKLDIKEFWSKFESWLLCANFEAGGEPKFSRHATKEANFERQIEKFKKKGILK